MLALLFVILSLFFYAVFLPGHTLFSNDGPLARLMSESHKLPERFTGCWQDLNASGYREPSAQPDITYALLLLLKPVGFSKFYAMVALLVLGMGAWFFFRQSGLAPPACILGSLAAVFNSCFFSDACWGTAAHTIAVGMTFFALAALMNNSSPRRWLRVILAGFAVGMAVTEGADFGAIFSLFVAAFILYWAWLDRGPRARNLTVGAARLVLVAVCAAVFSARAISDLVATNVIDVSTSRTGVSTAVERWDWATRWSLPKRETLSLIVPGIFGYRCDRPGSSTYWGSIGRDPAWFHYEENGRTGPTPAGPQRFTGGGFYAGVTALLIALWAAFQALRKKDSVFSLIQRKTLWFWLAMGGASLLLAYGRYAPFYAIFYQLPYVSMIRNPDKFLNVLSLSIVVLFAFGVDGLWRRYMRPADPRIMPRWTGLKNWWNSAAGFERNWMRGCRLTLVVSLVAWILYAFSRDSLTDYLHGARINEVDFGSVAAFSIRQVGWFVLFFVLAAGLMLLIMGGRFAGAHARWGAILLGLLLVADLGRADLPWIIFWNYQAMYESNPIVDSFREKPWEQRVAGFPLRPPPKYLEFERLYRLIWTQQLFPWYNIQTLDIVQLSRTPDDLADFNAAFRPSGFADAGRVARQWQLTNTRYLLGAAILPDFLVQRLGAEAPPLRIVSRFSVVPKPGCVETPNMDGMTAVPDTNGDYAVLEFPDALPRAKLYSNWQVNMSQKESLDMLVNPAFDPAHTVLVAGGVPAPPPAATNQDPGSVEITSYAPKDVVLKSDVRTPAVLLLNDRFEQHWKVAVDGTPRTLLRCNYLMRGVYLEPGTHTVEFTYQPPFHALYISLAALGVGIVLLGAVVVAEWRAPVPVPVPAPAPAPTPRPQPVPMPKTAPAAPAPGKQKKRAGKSRR
jgi:hypothetical protein